MAKENSGTLNSTPKTCVDCSLKTNRQVSYIFRTGLWEVDLLPSERKLTIPFALAINGKVDPAFAKKAGVVNAYKEKDGIFVESGQTVTLFLNSDATPAYRTSPVFAITPKDNDIEVIINERRGKLGDDDTPKFKETKEVSGKNGSKRLVDVYEATLTGDIWMKVTHKFTLDEAKALIPPETLPEIRAAVLKIYDGSLNGEMSISIKEEDESVRLIKLTFEEAVNALQNITSFNMHKDGLPRVHPRAWVAVIEAAQKAGVSKVQTSSAWRPQLGSILHRTGLALDVNYLDQVNLNRGELVNKGPDTANVSNEEKQLYQEKEAAGKEAVKAKAHLEKLQSEQQALLALKKKSPNKASPVRETELENEIKEAEIKLKTANENKSAADKAWDDERDKNEPTKVKTFRKQLSASKYVKAIFDPWFMDNDIHDHISAKPNEQKDGNEQLHRHHLHITINEPTLPAI